MTPHPADEIAARALDDAAQTVAIHWVTMRITDDEECARLVHAWLKARAEWVRAGAPTE